MAETEILEMLANRPDALRILQEANSFFAREKEERRKFHDLIHENMKAEFINGEIVMHSPVRLEHLEVSMNVSASIHQYAKSTEQGKVFVEKAMINLTRNDYEPDLCFFGREKVSKLYPGQLLFPAPDFIVEILSKTTEKNDRTIKFQDYAAHGVKEYWIIDPARQSVEQYLLENGEYHLQAKLTEGIIQSKVIEGYSISLKDIFE